VVLVVLVLVLEDDVVLGRVVVVARTVVATVAGVVARGLVVLVASVVGVLVVVESGPESSFCSWVTARRTRAIRTTAPMRPRTSGQLLLGRSGRSGPRGGRGGGGGGGSAGTTGMATVGS